MRDNRAMMLALLYGGPADGAELALHEPIRGRLVFPMPLPVAAALLAHPRVVAADWAQTEGIYVLAHTGDRPVRDPNGRVLYRYVVPHPTERTDRP